MSDMIVTHSSMTSAKKSGAKYYFTGVECLRGHIDKRYASDGSCVQCANMRARNRYLAKTDEILEQHRKRYLEDPEKIKGRVRKRKVENPEKVRAEKKAEYERHKRVYIDRAAKWTKANLEKSRKCGRNWVKNNPAKAREIVVLRRTRLAQRLPRWLTKKDKSEMLDLYKESAKLTKETGIKHNVDHILPLYGRLVSGLHVPGNLQILTAYENMSKNNKFIIE